MNNERSVEQTPDMVSLRERMEQEFLHGKVLNDPSMIEISSTLDDLIMEEMRRLYKNKDKPK